MVAYLYGVCHLIWLNMPTPIKNKNLGLKGILNFKYIKLLNKINYCLKNIHKQSCFEVDNLKSVNYKLIKVIFFQTKLLHCC